MGIKYDGYIKKQMDIIEKTTKYEGQKIPSGIDYLKIESISNEAREKLNDLKPVTVAQASRISGISPADITSLLIYLKKRENRKIKK